MRQLELLLGPQRLLAVLHRGGVPLVRILLGLRDFPLEHHDALGVARFELALLLLLLLEGVEAVVVFLEGLLRLLDLLGVPLCLVVDVVQFEHDVFRLELGELVLHANVLLGLLFLLFHLLAQGGSGLAPLQRGELLLLALLAQLERLVVVLFEIGGARDLLDERAELLGGLARHALDVALEHQKVPGLDQDAVLLQTLRVGLRGARLAVDLVLASAARVDVPGEADLGAILSLVEELDVSGPAFLPVREVEGVHQIPEHRASKLRGLDAEDEGDGVHQVGLAAAVRADDGRELLERADDLVALVRLEVVALDAGDHAAADGDRGVVLLGRLGPRARHLSRSPTGAQKAGEKKGRSA